MRSLGNFFVLHLSDTPLYVYPLFNEIVKGNLPGNLAIFARKFWQKSGQKKDFLTLESGSTEFAMNEQQQHTDKNKNKNLNRSK